LWQRSPPTESPLNAERHSQDGECEHGRGKHRHRSHAGDCQQGRDSQADSDAFKRAQNDHPPPDANEKPFDRRRFRPRVHREPRSRVETRDVVRAFAPILRQEGMQAPIPRTTGHLATCLLARSVTTRPRPLACSNSPAANP
jgi:hypothetical protein